jgi:hypothetical protein
MLIEVLVTATVIAAVGLGLLLGLEGASRGSGNSKHRSVAASLAQQDQDRMRSFKATDLSNYDEKRSITVAGVAYTINSSGSWVSDASGAISCTNASSRANYLKISSVVRWPGMRTKPVTLESLVAPPPGSFNASQGNVVVRLLDQSNSPVGGVPVTISAPSSPTRTTEPDGCVVFAGVPAGGYDLSYSLSGYVDPSGRNNVTDQPVTAFASTTKTYDLQYARAGSITVSFDTKVGSNPPQASAARSVTVQHSGMPQGSRTITPANGPHSAIQADSLFPFESAYSVYAGACPDGADPSIYDQTYYDSNPGHVLVTPGTGQSVTVRQPALNIAVTRGGTPIQNAHVVVRSEVPDCATSYDLAAATDAQGALRAPGFPFGKYTICADDGNHRTVVTGVNNTSPAGTSTISMPITNSGQSAVCT